MSWQLASLAVLGAVLAAGFLWYERTRPPARLLSMVAALAALATVGRIAFAPFPNVKPTTDIALFAGYALGPAPGFAVGAVAALASNFFFGQGPWTPWQMFAWGAVGAGGGLLAKLAGHDLGRAPLAVACGVAGAAFGAIMDCFQWTLGARQDLAHYLAISGGSLSFNLAHVIGNIVFCLAFGPGFVRALRRYRRRFTVRWPAPGAVAALVLAATAALAAIDAPAASASPASRALSYLESVQNDDGGYGSAPGVGSTQLHTGWAALGLEAAGVDAKTVKRSGNSPLDYTRANVAQLTGIGDIERTILVVQAAGLSPRSFAGRDLVAELAAHQSANGSFSGSVNWTAFGALALHAAGAPGADAAGRWLLAHQNGDGGFGFGPRAASDVDDTGAVLEGLVAAGVDRAAVVSRAVSYLRSVQNGDGGYPMQAGEDSNAQSTAWAAQGLDATGVGATSIKSHGHGPMAYLAGLQASDGSVHYSATSNQTPVWVTAQALAALERRPFPLAVATASAGGGGAARPTAHAGTATHAATGGTHRAGRHAGAAAPAASGSAPPRSLDTGTRASGPAAGLPAWELVALVAVALAALLAGWWLFRRWWVGSPGASPVMAEPPPPAALPAFAPAQANGHPQAVVEHPPVDHQTRWVPEDDVLVEHQPEEWPAEDLPVGPVTLERRWRPPPGPTIFELPPEPVEKQKRRRTARRHAHVPAHMR